MTFYGQEKVEYNAQLCLMNMAVHGLTGVIKSGNEANTFYNDAHNLAGCCDYVMANASDVFALTAKNRVESTLSGIGPYFFALESGRDKAA